MNYKEEMRKFKRKLFIRDLVSLIFIVGLFSVCFYIALKIQPTRFTYEERQEQLNHWRER